MEKSSFGSECADDSTVESREESMVQSCSDCEYCYDDIVEGESGEGWESESIANDSLYVPTPLRLNKARPIDLPNNLGFIALPQLGKFVDMLNGVRGCKTPGCKGNLVPTYVNSQVLGGSLTITFNCDGCSMNPVVFDTCSLKEEDGNTVSRSVQVAFIVAGSTHAVYYKTLKHALGINAVSNPVFMDTIYYMYPVVKSMLDDICAAAKQEMKAKGDDELGSWKRAVTVADGTWQTRGWHSKNATFTIRNYLTGALLYYHHLCQKGRDKAIDTELYKGTSKSAEGYAARITFRKAKEEGMQIAIHWQDADSSSAKAVFEVYPDAEIMICGGHAGRAHRKILELRHKMKKVSTKMLEKYKDTFPALSEVRCKCEGRNHSSSCGCLNPPFISKAHTNFTSILMVAQSQEEFATRVRALPYHARDIHKWEGGRCDFHPLRVCTCKRCPNKERIECEGKPYKTKMKLDCEFHALLYEIECTERAAQASKLVHPILKRGHSNAVEASHNVLIRFRSKDVYLERLHYQLSTNLGLLQANLTYMHEKLGTGYHWLPELYKRMKLPVFEGVVEALQKHSERRKRELELAKTTPAKKCRINQKKERVTEGIERIRWSKEHGRDTYLSGSDVEENVCDSNDGVNQKSSAHGKGKSRSQGKCAACGASTHLRSNHRDCPFYKGRAKKESNSANSVVVPDSASGEAMSDSDLLESGEDTSDGYSSDSESISCTCGVEGRAHKRGCPLSSRTRMFGRNLFPAPSEPDSHTEPSMSEAKYVSSPQTVKYDMNIGDYVCIHSKSIEGFHIPCRIVGEFAGRFQLYCSKGVLNTSFSCAELIPLTGCSTIPLNEWRIAPRISFRTATNDTTLHEFCTCSVPTASDSIMLSSASEEEEVPEVWVNTTAYCLNHHDQLVVLSQKGWLTDKIICAAQMTLLQYFPHMAGLQPPTLQKVFAFWVHSGAFVQIIHVRNNHWCVVSTVGCQSGVVSVYDSLYKTLSKETEYLIASMVYFPSSDLKIMMMDVEKQSNGSDCGVLAIAYAFDICSGNDPCSVRFDHSKIRPHLAACLENCQVCRFPILGDRVSVQRKPKTVELHCSCRMPERDGERFAECDSCHIWYHRHCMDIPSEVFGEDSEVHWECKRCVQSLTQPSTTGKFIQPEDIQ